AGAGVEPERVSFVRDTYRFNSLSTPAQLVSEFRSYYGPTMNAFEAAEANGRSSELEEELVALFTEKNESPDGTTTS
ncbi:hypothetical protein, partial [Serratia marcescens]|uniref:hypothetical protein n=1 Tax=Serratia marcescens TaxID=615 RepID=UPI002812D487